MPKRWRKKPTAPNWRPLGEVVAELEQTQVLMPKHEGDFVWPSWVAVGTGRFILPIGVFQYTLTRQSGGWRIERSAGYVACAQTSNGPAGMVLVGYITNSGAFVEAQAHDMPLEVERVEAASKVVYLDDEDTAVPALRRIISDRHIRVDMAMHCWDGAPQPALVSPIETTRRRLGDGTNGQ